MTVNLLCRSFKLTKKTHLADPIHDNRSSVRKISEVCHVRFELLCLAINFP